MSDNNQHPGPTRLKPATLPKPDVSAHDRIMAALTQAIKDQQIDNELDQSARGIAIVFFREYADERYGESYIIEGMNALEAVGLLSMTAIDITQVGLNEGPDHFPAGRPPPRNEGDEPA